MHNKKTDIVILAVPKLMTLTPPIAPYLLRAVVEDAGFSCAVLDLNLDLHRRLGDSNDLFNENKTFYASRKKSRALFAELRESTLEPILHEWAQQILAYAPKVIGISLFSSHSVLTTAEIMRVIRAYQPAQKFLLGGPFTTFMNESAYAADILGKDFDVIRGDGERALVEYLQGNMEYPGINSDPIPFRDFATVPIPNYAGVDFEQYGTMYNERRALVTGSRGCVRSCTYCDIAAVWPKFLQRPPELIFAEIKNLHEQHRVQKIEFTDSLVNGNMKAFRQLCQLLREYRMQEDVDFRWQGQFICRSPSSFTAADYKLMAESGCSHLSIGIESASEKVRREMRKHFSNDDLYFMLAQLYENKISITMLMLIGYLTETEADFEETLELMRRCKELGYFEEDADGYRLIASVSWGGTLSIPPKTQLEHIAYSALNVQIDDEGNWYLGDNTRVLRLRRLFRALDTMKELGIEGSSQTLTAYRYKYLREELDELEAKYASMPAKAPAATEIHSGL